MKKFLLIALAFVCALGTMAPVMAFASEVSDTEADEMRKKYNEDENEKDSSDYMDYDYEYNDGSIGQAVSLRVNITDRKCYEVMYDALAQKEVYAQGRVAIIVYGNNQDKAVEQEWYPSSFTRKTNLSMLEDGTNPNEFNDSLVGFLKSLIGNSYTTGISYDSFCSYLDYLVEDFGMYSSERDVWKYEWREYNNALTPEDIAKLEKERLEAEEWAQKIAEENEANKKIHEDNANELEGNKLTLYEREAKMIASNCSSWIKFDEEKYISLREKGYSFIDASQAAKTVDYEAFLAEAGKDIENNKEWLESTISDLKSDNVQDSLNNISSNVWEMLKELFGVE